MDILPILCCPESRQPLHEATPEELKRFGAESGLVREDGKILYPIQNGIPLLIPSAASAPKP